MLGKKSNHNVITVCSTTNVNLVKSLVADTVIDYTVGGEEEKGKICVIII